MANDQKDTEDFSNGILNFSAANAKLLVDYFNSLQDKRKERKQNESVKTYEDKKNNARSAFLKYLRYVIKSFPYFDAEDPRIPLHPFENLDYDKMVEILADELYDDLWGNVFNYRVNGGEVQVLYDVESNFLILLLLLLISSNIFYLLFFRSLR